tara:strand:- start:2830 stop:3774 length:945 start_codon:yes stop_codon:yes gene_type:complete
MNKLDLLSVGSWTIFDYILRSKNYPKEGETITLEMPHKLLQKKYYGDCSANVAAAASSSGAKTGLGMIVGEDFDTYGYREHMVKLGVDLNGVEVRLGKKSGYSYNIANKKGRGICLSHLGIAKNQSDWKPPYNEIKKSRAVVISEKFSSYTLKTIVNAKSLGKITAINGMVKTANKKLIDFLKATDYLFINQKEFEAVLAALNLNDAKDIFSIGPSMIVVTEGSKGSHWFLKNKKFTCDAVSTSCAKDTTGAGDAFTGASIAKLLQGYSPEEAAKYASTVSSFVVEKWGCQTNLVNSKYIKKRMNSFFKKKQLR